MATKPKQAIPVHPAKNFKWKVNLKTGEWLGISMITDWCTRGTRSIPIGSIWSVANSDTDENEFKIEGQGETKLFTLTDTKYDNSKFEDLLYWLFASQCGKYKIVIYNEF